MEQLMFKYPVFKEGLNVTVRQGDKWWNFWVKDNPERKPKTVELATPDGKVFDIGVIEQVKNAEFVMVPSYVLALEHDPKCRTLDGLYNVMKEVYPDFYAGADVSVVFFTVNK
jgi:hypothetical protein